MTLDEQYWRPITFEGVTFPPSLMAVSVLDSILTNDDHELKVWLWRLPVCCGVTSRAPAKQCARAARRAVELLIEQREHVLAGIERLLAPHGFDTATTYDEWLFAFRRIAELSLVAGRECLWSAPTQDKDPFKSTADLKKFIGRLRKGGAWPIPQK